MDLLWGWRNEQASSAADRERRRNVPWSRDSVNADGYGEYAVLSTQETGCVPCTAYWVLVELSVNGFQLSVGLRPFRTTVN